MGKGHGRAIEVNMDYREYMTRGKAFFIGRMWSSSSLKAYMVHDSNSSLGGALKSPGKNGLFCIDFRQSRESNSPP